MMCPNEDKLYAYIDGFLDDEEKNTVESHIESCLYCQQQLEVIAKEDELLKETLKAPVLPNEFADTIVSQLKPYKRKRNRSMKWMLGTAASLCLAGGIVMTVNPGFAKLIGGIFSSETVDEGLQMAVDTDIATPVNLSVTDAGITLHVEDVIADTSRIAFSYRVTNEQGKTLDPFIEGVDLSAIKLLDENNKEVQLRSMSWGSHDDYGIYELSLVEIDDFSKGTIQLNINQLAGKNGHWQVEIPIDLTPALEHQKVVALNEFIEIEDVKINLNKVRYATSATEIDYTLEFTDEAKEQLYKQLKEKELQFNEEIVYPFFPHFPRIGYRIENNKGEVLGYENIYAEENRGYPVSENMISGNGWWDGDAKELGPITKVDSFVPEKGEEELYFVVDTIYRPKVSDFSITFKPNELPKTFEYNGYELTIESIDDKTDYSLEKSWMPIKSQKSIEVHMTGFSEQKAPNLDLWAISDEKGKSYSIFNSGRSILDETDEKGRFKQTIQLVTYDLKDIPEEITLHIIAETEVIELEKEWRVPLFQK
ncbi:MAG: DUF4179 domain-containing protein [Lysinibacillus sp.]|nr:DUF4179 domain-containing protein [Lysinibacillus sp.]